jgi:hypothetical protein
MVPLLRPRQRCVSHFIPTELQDSGMDKLGKFILWFRPIMQVPKAHSVGMDVEVAGGFF